MDGLEPWRPNVFDGKSATSYNPVASTYNRSAEEQRRINSATGKPTVEKSNVKAPQVRNGGGLKGTSESGQGADVIATHPDEKPVSLDGIVISFGALTTTLGGTLKEADFGKLLEITTKYVELNQSAEDKKGEITSETKRGGNPDMIPSTENNKGKAGSENSKLKIGAVFYTPWLGFNRVKLTDSTARMGTSRDGPAKDTLKPGQGF